MPFNKVKHVEAQSLKANFFLKTVAFVCLATLTAAIFYSATGKAEESEPGESATAESGEAKAGADKKTQHPDAVEWYKRTQKLAALETRIKEQSKNLQTLIASKNAGNRFVKDEKLGTVDILNKIVESHRELMETYDKFEEEKREVKYRYPGEGDVVERRYLSSRPPTVEQLENELGLDGQLTELSEKISKKYNKFNPAPAKSPTRRDAPKSSIGSPVEEKSDKPKLKLVR